MEGASENPLVSRRLFLRGAVIAGGAALAVPVVGTEPARCGPRAAGQAGGTVPEGVSEADLMTVTDSILCEGKCGKTVYMGELTDACPIATKMKNEAATYLAQGMTTDQAIERFVADFGEDVLAAPAKSGFDLIPWMLPLAGVSAGAVGIAILASRWRQARPEVAPSLPPTDPDLLARVNDEVEEGF